MKYFQNPWKPNFSRNFLIGLVVSLGLILIVVNLQFNKTIYESAPGLEPEGPVEIPVTRTLQKERQQKVPPPVKFEKIEASDIPQVSFVEQKEPEFNYVDGAASDRISNDKSSYIGTDVPAPPAEFKDEAPPLTFAQHWPYYGDCRNIEGGPEEKKQCSTNAILQFLASEIHYPESARKKGLEGKAIIEVVVGTDGLLESATLVRDPGFEMGSEALRAVNKMEGFSPARNNGRSVRFKMYIPVVFKLN